MKETDQLLSLSQSPAALLPQLGLSPLWGTQKIKLHFLPLGVSVVFLITAGRLHFYFYTVKNINSGLGGNTCIGITVRSPSESDGSSPQRLAENSLGGQSIITPLNTFRTFSPS